MVAYSWGIGSLSNQIQTQVRRPFQLFSSTRFGYTSETVEFSPDGMLNLDGTFSGNGLITRDDWTYAWSVEGTLTPLTPFAFHRVMLTGQLVNLGEIAQSFALSAEMPVSLLAPGSVANGLYSMNFQDLNGDGAVFSTDPATQTPFFTGLIDRVSYVTDGPAPLGMTASPGGGNGFLFPPGYSVSAPTPAVHESIALRIAFSISSQDQIKVMGNLGVQPVPEPGGLFAMVFFAFSFVVAINRAKHS